MRIEEYKIGKENPHLRFVTNPEDPYLKITTDQNGYTPINGDEVEVAIVKIEIEYFNAKPITKTYHYSNKEIYGNTETFSEIESSLIKSIEFTVVKCDFKVFEIDLKIQTGRTILNILNPIEKFWEEIKEGRNTKILFSGPFGQGKTTFLNEFFDQSRNNYEVFKVFPVNYSVASNEDIFKYIKTDILFQLLATEVEFDKSEISLFSAFEEYIYLNPKKTILSFLKNASHLNAKTAAIAKVVDSLNEFMKPVFKYHIENKVDEKELAIDYLKDVYEKEGSLFEDNFYTQLIRQSLEKLNATTKKENVLIIEDLDRMDPDHIFRILNVISAHYDFYTANEDIAHHNKFGFDKIIVVCDVNNIQNIFHHKYGINTDFNGYINKFSSSKPFEYDNKAMMTYLLENELKSKDKSLRRSQEVSIQALSLFLNSLVEGDQLTLREILKLIKFNYLDFDFDERGEMHYFSICRFTRPIAYLTNIFGYEVFKNKIGVLLQKEIVVGYTNYTSEAGELIPGLINLENRDFKNKEINFNYHSKVYVIKVVEDSFEDCIKIEDIKIQEKPNLPPSSNVTFTNIDFYNLLIDNIKKYNQIKKK